MKKRKLSRRDFLLLTGGAAAGTLLAACQEKVVKETVEVEKLVQETVEVEKVVSQEVEKIVTPTPAPREPVTIRFISLAPEYYYNNDAFSEQSNWVNVEFEDIGDVGYEEAITTSVASGDPPELAWIGDARLWRFAQIGACVNISSLVESSPHPELNQIDPAAIARFNSPDAFSKGQVRMAPGQYGWPIYNTVFHMVFNKHIFDEAGLDYPSRGWTWDDFRTTLQKVSNPDNQVWGMVMHQENNYVHNMIWTNGGDVYDAEGKCALASPEAAESVQFLQDLIVKDGTVILPGATEGVEFTGGNTAFQYFGNFVIGWYDGAMEDPYGIVPVPMKKQEAIWSSIDGFMFLNGAANPEAGWEFAEWLSSYEGQKVLNDEDQAEVVSVNKLAVAESYVNPNYGVPEGAEDWFPDAAFEIARFDPWIPVGPGFNYPTAYDGIWLGDSVEDTLAQIAQDIDRLNEGATTFG